MGGGGGVAFLFFGGLVRVGGESGGRSWWGFVYFETRGKVLVDEDD